MKIVALSLRIRRRARRPAGGRLHSRAQSGLLSVKLLPAYDEFPGARGAFGLTENNPVAVNGPCGAHEFRAALARLAGKNGEVVAASPADLDLEDVEKQANWTDAIRMDHVLRLELHHAWIDACVGIAGVRRDESRT